MGGEVVEPGCLHRVLRKLKVLADDVGDLAELKDAGIVTEEEFAAKKAEMLSRL